MSSRPNSGGKPRAKKGGADRNLCVCDASVLTDRWGPPATLTVIELGNRLAADLAGSEADGGERAQRGVEAGGSLLRG